MVSGTGIAVLTVVIMFVRFSVNTYVIANDVWHISHAQKFVKFIITGITVLVVAVPEGLPLAVTLSLAYSVKVILLMVIYRLQILKYLMTFSFLHFAENDDR